MAGIDLPKSPNVFHPEKPSAVGSRNSLVQEFRDQQAEVDLLLSEEVDKVMNHIASKLPKEVAERLERAIGLPAAVAHPGSGSRRLLSVEHETHYDYSAPVDVSEHVAYLRPLDDGRQRVERFGGRVSEVSATRDGRTIRFELTADGENILDKRLDVSLIRAKVGMVFQKPTPFPMSIYDNIAFGVRLFENLGHAEMDERVEWALKKAALWNEVKDRLRQPGLHFIGEVVDVTGWLGGYNFQWAWASAAACARSSTRPTATARISPAADRPRRAPAGRAGPVHRPAPLARPAPPAPGGRQAPGPPSRSRP